jgi:hypothetical protein
MTKAEELFHTIAAGRSDVMEVKMWQRVRTYPFSFSLMKKKQKIKNERSLPTSFTASRSFRPHARLR